LSLGLQEAGFDVILGVDLYTFAVATHHANFGGVSLHGDLLNRSRLKSIVKELKGIPISLIAGGPPCQPFSRAGKNKIRSLGRAEDTDRRRELWRSFVYLVKRIKPNCILIENVPELAFGESSIIFRKIVEALEVVGYEVDARILSAWHFGVPQHRQRLIIIGFRDCWSFKWPQMRTGEKVTVWDAIGDLPAVAGGARQVELKYQGSKTPFQRWSRRGVSRRDKKKIYDHLTRAVRDDDLEAFRLMNDGTLYSELPKHLRRYRSDIFEDKYKRLPWDGLSRSITAHIGKDGYWYIHPEQHRTLTIREAARIQTFPDRFRFAGSPSHAFRQIGEAVPPELARAVGKEICFALKSSKRRPSRLPTRILATKLRLWLKTTPSDELAAPWRQSREFWQVLLGTILCNRLTREKSQVLWRLCKRDWSRAENFLNDRQRHSKLTKHSWQNKNRFLTAIATRLVEAKENSSLSTLSTGIPGFYSGSLEVAFAIAGLNSRRPVTAAARRVVERLFGESVNGSKTHAELLIGKVVGIDETGQAYAALLEVGELFCRIDRTECHLCPLEPFCHHAIKRDGKRTRKNQAR
jgi:DNA (cytosine-5)-methyltransferase 1